MKSILFSTLFIFSFNVFQVLAQDTTKVEIIIECENDGDFINYYLLVRNFVEMEAVQGTLVWNADSIGFVEFENQGIPSFSSASDLNLNEVEAGILRFVWFNSSSTGATIADDGVMFRLRFEIKEGIGNLELTGDPVQLLFLDSDFQEATLEISYGNACVLSSINNFFQEEEIFLYPNPIKSGRELIMDSKNGLNKIHQYSIYSLEGKKIFSSINTGLERSIYFPHNIKPGSYFLQLKDEDKKIYTSQIIVY